MYKVKNGLVLDKVPILFVHKILHAGFEGSFSDTQYGKHTIRYLGPILWLIYIKKKIKENLLAPG